MKNLIRRIRNSAVAWSATGTILRIGTGVFLLPIVLHKLPQEQLGLWYVFTSIAGLALLLDMGIGIISTKSVSYLYAGANELIPFGIDATTEASGPNWAMLSVLVGTLKRFYFLLSFLLFSLFVTFGSWYLVVSSQLEIQYFLPAWLLFSASTSLAFFVRIWSSAMTGMGHVTEAARIAVWVQLVNYAICIPALFLNCGLYSLVLGNLGSTMAARFLTVHYLSHKVFPSEFRPARPKWSIIKTLWPQSWRIALVALATYLINQGTILICNTNESLAQTASYGLTMSLVMMLSSISSLWVDTKMPEISILRTQRRTEDIAKIFTSRLKLTYLTYILGSLVLVFIAPIALEMLSSDTTLLEKPMLILALVIYFFETNCAKHGSLVATENVNPFYITSIISGVLIALGGIFLMPTIGVLGLLVAHLVVQSLYNFWWVAIRAILGLEMGLGNYVRLFLRSRPFMNL